MRTIPIDSPSCKHNVETWLTKLLFYHSCSIMLTVLLQLLQGCWANNPVIASDIFARIVDELLKISVKGVFIYGVSTYRYFFFYCHTNPCCIPRVTMETNQIPNFLFRLGSGFREQRQCRVFCLRHFKFKTDTYSRHVDDGIGFEPSEGEKWGNIMQTFKSKS